MPLQTTRWPWLRLWLWLWSGALLVGHHPLGPGPGLAPAWGPGTSQVPVLRPLWPQESLSWEMWGLTQVASG